MKQVLVFHSTVYTNITKQLDEERRNGSNVSKFKAVLQLGDRHLGFCRNLISVLRDSQN